MKEWKFEQEFPKVPVCVHQTVLETLENLNARGNEKHIIKTKWLILAAALTATFGLTVVAAELFDWNPKAAKTFGEPVKEVQNTLTMEVLDTLCILIMLCIITIPKLTSLCF